MNNNKKIIIILISIVFLFILLLICVYLFIYLKINGKPKENVQIASSINQNETVFNETKEKSEIQKIIEEHNSEYIKEVKGSKYRIYCNFQKDLFDEYGNSNEVYFLDIIEDLKRKIELSFELIDEEKKINIEVILDTETNTYRILFNNNENFYDEINGNNYMIIDNLEIVNETKNMKPKDSVLSGLINDGMMIKNVKSKLGESKELDNGYISYSDDSVLVMQTRGKARNVILTQGYDGEILKGVKVGTPLSEILEKYPEHAFGSIREGYLGYRTETNYIFFYDDQVSMWEYYYYNNIDFENYIINYIKTGDLEKFVKYVTDGWSNYIVYKEFDPNTNSVHLFYPTRGFEINVENNEKKEIIIYNNYYYTDRVKKLVKENKIIVKDEDAIQKVELERRNNN